MAPWDSRALSMSLCKACGQRRAKHPNKQFCPLPVLPERLAEDSRESDSASFGTCSYYDENEWELLEHETSGDKPVVPAAEDPGPELELRHPLCNSSA